MQRYRHTQTGELKHKDDYKKKKNEQPEVRIDKSDNKRRFFVIYLFPCLKRENTEYIFDV